MSSKGLRFRARPEGGLRLRATFAAVLERQVLIMPSNVMVVAFILLEYTADRADEFVENRRRNRDWILPGS